MAGYTKLFNSILASTIWRADDKTRIVWITLLAMADKNGMAEGSIPGLADMARVSIEDCERALIELESPDKYSRSKENEGRRIRTVDGGWFLLNHPKYREKMSADERREYNRVKQAEWRASQKLSTGVNDNKQMSALSAHSEAAPSPKATPEAVPPKEHTSTRARGTLDEIISFCSESGLAKADAEYCFHKWEGNGWKNAGQPIKSWKSTIRSWKASGYLPSQKNGPSNRRTEADRDRERTGFPQDTGPLKNVIRGSDIIKQANSGQA